MKDRKRSPIRRGNIVTMENCSNGEQIMGKLFSIFCVPVLYYFSHRKMIECTITNQRLVKCDDYPFFNGKVVGQLCHLQHSTAY